MVKISSFFVAFLENMNFNKEEKGKNITNILSVTSVQPTVIELQCYKIVVSTSSIALYCSS